jgi:hypothetical protein
MMPASLVKLIEISEEPAVRTQDICFDDGRIMLPCFRSERSKTYVITTTRIIAYILILKYAEKNFPVDCDDYVTWTICIFTFRIAWEHYDKSKGHPRTGHESPEGK